MATAAENSALWLARSQKGQRRGAAPVASSPTTTVDATTAPVAAANTTPTGAPGTVAAPTGERDRTVTTPVPAAAATTAPTPLAAPRGNSATSISGSSSSGGRSNRAGALPPDPEWDALVAEDAARRTEAKDLYAKINSQYIDPSRLNPDQYQQAISDIQRYLTLAGLLGETNRTDPNGVQAKLTNLITQYEERTKFWEGFTNDASTLQGIQALANGEGLEDLASVKGVSSDFDRQANMVSALSGGGEDVRSSALVQARQSAIAQREQDARKLVMLQEQLAAQDEAMSLVNDMTAQFQAYEFANMDINAALAMAYNSLDQTREDLNATIKNARILEAARERAARHQSEDNFRNMLIGSAIGLGSSAIIAAI